MADLITQSLTATTVTAGGTTRVQVFGGTVGYQFLVCDFELTAAQAAQLAGASVQTPVYYVGNQTVDLSAANNTAYTMNNTSGKPIVGAMAVGQQISIATKGGSLPNTVVQIVTVDNNTSLHVTYVSGANAANVTAGDIVTITSPATSASTTVTQVAAPSPLPGVYNAL